MIGRTIWHDVDVIDESDQGGEAPCWAHLVDELEPLRPLGSNIIFYCHEWPEVVAFYRNTLGLETTMETDWFVEFVLQPGAHVSIADASRASVAAGDGSGVTLSLLVNDAESARSRLIAHQVEVTPLRMTWGSPAFFVSDPAGNRIEFWSNGAAAEA